LVIAISSGMRLAFEEKLGRRSAAKMLTKDEARRTRRSCRNCCVKNPKSNEAHLMDFPSLPKMLSRDFKENGDY
jgi:hypothetical protein